VLFGACSSEDSAVGTTQPGDAGGKSGQAGTSAAGGGAGTAGQAGTAGVAGQSGTAGQTAGSAGTAGQTAGNAGTAGSAGTAGTAGTAGGSAGTAGQAGGSAGAAGGQAGSGGQPSGWQVPTCTTIEGIEGFGFGFQEGETIVGTTTSSTPGIVYTMGLVALQIPNVLIAQHANSLYRSEDAGCHWTNIGDVTFAPLRLVAGKGDHAWAWSDNNDSIYHITGTTVTKVTPPVSNVIGIGTDLTDPMHIRIGGYGGSLFETFDGGGLWKGVGSKASGSELSYHVVFDPNDLDHVIFGRATEGFYVTKNGAQTWEQSTGLGIQPTDKINGFDAAVSASDGLVVWALGINVNDPEPKGSGRRLYRSEDGGVTFKQIVKNLEKDDVVLTNGTHLVPHPTKPDLLYFSFGTCQSGYGTNLYRYDAAQQLLTWKNHPYFSFGELVVSPAQADFLYIGINMSDNPLCP
jgi:hypothetical protein